MTTIGLVVTIVAVVVAVGLAGAWWWDRRWPRQARRVVVNLEGQDGGIRGLLLARRGPWLLLTQTELIQADGSIVPIDGQILIERARILFVQVLP